jgi:hypothetical protein
MSPNKPTPPRDSGSAGLHWSAVVLVLLAALGMAALISVLGAATIVR